MLSATADGPVDIYRAVHLGSEMARERGLDVGPEAVTYAADRLKSKIERDAVYNPVTEVHAGILAHRFLREWHGGEVVYLDVYKLRRERLEAESRREQAKRERPKGDEAEPEARATRRGRLEAKAVGVARPQDTPSLGKPLRRSLLPGRGCLDGRAGWRRQVHALDRRGVGDDHRQAALR